MMMAKTKVTYKGLSDRRVLPYEALKGLNAAEGLEADKDLVFTRRGPGATLEIELNDRLKEILQKDGGFEIAEAGVEATGEGPAGKMVDGDSGATSEGSKVEGEAQEPTPQPGPSGANRGATGERI